MIINLPRGLSFDLDHLPYDFEEQEKIEKMLIRLINAVLSYEKGGKHE